MNNKFKSTGIIRRIDDLGRIQIPKEIRRSLRLQEGDTLEFYTNNDNNNQIMLQKYTPREDISIYLLQVKMPGSNEFVIQNVFKNRRDAEQQGEKMRNTYKEFNYIITTWELK